MNGTVVNALIGVPVGIGVLVVVVLVIAWVGGEPWDWWKS